MISEVIRPLPEIPEYAHVPSKGPETGLKLKILPR